jgi:hypothetical protein
VNFLWAHSIRSVTNCLGAHNPQRIYKVDWFAQASNIPGFPPNTCRASIRTLNGPAIGVRCKLGSDLPPVLIDRPIRTGVLGYCHLPGDFLEPAIGTQLPEQGREGGCLCCFESSIGLFAPFNSCFLSRGIPKRPSRFYYELRRSHLHDPCRAAMTQRLIDLATHPKAMQQNG